MYLIVAIGNINHHLIAILIQLTLNRQRVKVLSIVLGNLLSVHRQGLSEIAITIEEANCTHINIGVRSFLQIVTSQHTQATRVNLQHLIQAILHGEVSNRGALLVGFDIDVLAEFLVDLLDIVHQHTILDNGHLTVIAQTLQEQNWVVINFLEKVTVKSLEKATGLIVPCPPHIVS